MQGTGQGEVWDKAALRDLRGAAYRGDGHGVVAALAGRPLDRVLQLAGDGLLAALAQRTAVGMELARSCHDQLRARDAEGDKELADELAAALGGPAPLLRPVPVNLDELSGCLEGDPAFGGGRLDLTTGEVWPAGVAELGTDADERDDDEAPDRWLAVECPGSRSGYRDMVHFAATVSDRGLADRLDIALNGRGAFRRFKDLLGREPAELERWWVYSEDRRRGRARAWLATHGLRPAVRG